MIPYSFEYYKPDTVEEAVELFNNMTALKKKPIYYGGGTEFISMARKFNRYADSVIDIKGIPELTLMELYNGKLIIGGGVTLTRIAEENYFPLLSKTVKRIADHTIQDKITLGGNILGTIIYRESILPLLCADSILVLEGNRGQRHVKLMDIYKKKIVLKEDEILIKVIIDEEYLQCPFQHVKRTKNEMIDYPLITMAAIKTQKNKVNLAVSGLYDYPFRNIDMENILSDNKLKIEDRVKKCMKLVSGNVLDDVSSSSDYRRFVFSQILEEILESFEVK